MPVVLTSSYLKSLKATGSSYRVIDLSHHRGVGRLMVKVSQAGKKTFYFLYSGGNGREKMLRIGNFPDLSLSEARQQFNRYSSQLVSGIDPKEYMIQEEERLKLAEEEKARVAKAAEMLGSLQQLFDYHMSVMEQRNRKKYRDDVRLTYEKHVFPYISPLRKVRDITSRELTEVIARVYQKSQVQSNRVRSHLHAGFNLALKHDNNPANLNTEVAFELTHNPVSNIPRQAEAEKPRDRFLSETELSDFIKALNVVGFSPVTRLTILLMIYSGGQRPNEIMGSRWKDIDFNANEWLFPGTLTKNKRPHVVPITGKLRELLLELEPLTGQSLYIIPARLDYTKPARSDSLAQSFSRYCKRTNTEGFTPRDIRRTCKTLMTRHRLGSKEVIDRLHNHALNDVSNKHYNRHDYLEEKRRLLTAWEEKLLNIILTTHTSEGYFSKIQ